MKKELKNSLKAGALPVFYIGLYLLYYLWIFAFEKIYQYYAAQLRYTFQVTLVGRVCIVGGYVVAMLILLARSSVSEKLANGWKAAALRVLFLVVSVATYPYFQTMLAVRLCYLIWGQCIFDLLQSAFFAWRRRGQKQRQQP